jgi:hypothetical protein
VMNAGILVLLSHVHQTAKGWDRCSAGSALGAAMNFCNSWTIHFDSSFT